VNWAVTILLTIIVAALAVRWFVNASPARLARGIRLGAIWLGIGVMLALIATGRLPMAMALPVLLIPLFLAILALRRRQPPSADRDEAGGQRSTVTTDFLDMAFDHDSGALDGRVTSGAFAGRALSAMSLDELRILLHDVLAARDAQSANILTTYLDRTFGDDWRADEASRDRPADKGGATMTRDEAWRVLGLSPGASDEEIRAAHRRLMKQAHPDHGGSDYLASKINEAKDILLGA